MPNDFLQALENTEESSLEYREGVLNIIWFSCDGMGLSVVHKLIQEGNNIVLAFIENREDIGEDKEDTEVKRRRMSLYGGILDKLDHRKVLKQMSKIENKNEWIVFFDFNNMGIVAEKVLAMGFKKGLFPTTKDTELEKDRNKAKEIVEQYYPDLTLGEVHDFSKIDEALKFLDGTDKLWVLKGNGDSENCKTIVPNKEDPELAKQIIIDALESHQKDYEAGGFILEEKITDGYELTPQAVFIDGELVFTDIDIENKPIGAGNESVQVGAMQTLVIKSSPKDRINKIAFPKWVYQRAKEHTGMFIVDAGIIRKDDVYYFCEFCFNRFGFDSFFAEISMSGSATEFFTKMFNGKNPLKDTFGVAVRGLNPHKDGKERRVLEGISMNSSDFEHTFIYECKAEDEKLVSTGVSWDMVVFSGSGDTVEKATEEAYEQEDNFSFEDLLFRPKFDFLSTDYQSSIANRFNELNHKLFEAPDMMSKKEYDMKAKVEELSKQMEEALNENTDEQE